MRTRNFIWNMMESGHRITHSDLRRATQASYR